MVFLGNINKDLMNLRSCLEILRENQARGRGRSIIGGAHIHIFVFTDCKNNRFQKKLMMHNTNI